MIQKLAVSAALGCAFLASAGCASVLRQEAMSPDKALFDRAVQTIYDSRLEEARILLETLISSYPESEYVTRAKLTLDDICYVEGGIAPLRETPGAGGMTFFPPLKEAPVEIPEVTNSRTKNL